MKKVSGIILVLFAVFITASSFINVKEQENDKVNWLSLQQLKEVYAKNPKPVILDIYTSWCGWCKVMDRETYGKKKVISYINDNYYAVKFDAETKDTVEFAGKKYGYNAEYKTNELAIHLTYGQLGYPTTVLLASIDAQPAPLSGYLKPKELEGPLKFFGDGAYKSSNYPEFMKKFTASW